MLPGDEKCVINFKLRNKLSQIKSRVNGASNRRNSFAFFRFKSTDQAGTKISNREQSSLHVQFYALCSRFLRILCRTGEERRHRTGISLRPILE
jgi:hypothetical protein